MMFPLVSTPRHKHAWRHAADPTGTSRSWTAFQARSKMHTDELIDQLEHQIAEVRDHVSELRKLAVSTQQKDELEKKRFSRELYDDLGQRLSVLKLDLDWLQTRLVGADAVIPARIAQMQRLLENIIARTKNIATTLRPPLLDDFGLLPAIEWMVDAFQKRTAVVCCFEKRGVAIQAGAPAESTIFRLIQEGLMNIERHAHASSVRILIEQSGLQFDIRIEDNGIGVKPSDIDKPGCYGLTAMRERVVILGGTIALDNIEPTGFSIHASIPLDHSPNIVASL